MIRFLLDFHLVASTVYSQKQREDMTEHGKKEMGDSISRWKRRELRGQTSPSTVSHQRKLSSET